MTGMDAELDAIRSRIIEEFLDGYEPSLLQRPLTAQERRVVQEVLFDFLTDDIDVGPYSEWAGISRRLLACTEQLALRQRDRMRSSVQQATRHIGSLRQQLARRERSFDLMREHLLRLTAQSGDESSCG